MIITDLKILDKEKKKSNPNDKGKKRSDPNKILDKGKKDFIPIKYYRYGKILDKEKKDLILVKYWIKEKRFYHNKYWMKEKRSDTKLISYNHNYQQEI